MTLKRASGSPLGVGQLLQRVVEARADFDQVPSQS
jgi:hypothetical protein